MNPFRIVGPLAVMVVLSLGTSFGGGRAFAADEDEATSKESSKDSSGDADAKPAASASAEDKAALEAGEIPKGKWIAGGIVASTAGFGIGQAIEGRYLKTGWIFTLGDTASATAMVYGLVVTYQQPGCNPFSYGYSYSYGSCTLSPWYFVGFAGWIGFHVFEALDAWLAPPAQNRAYRKAKGIKEDEASFLLLPSGKDGLVAGLQLHF